MVFNENRPNALEQPLGNLYFKFMLKKAKRAAALLLCWLFALIALFGQSAAKMSMPPPSTDVQGTQQSISFK